MKLRETVGLKTLQEITLGKKRPLSQTATHRQTKLVQKTGRKSVASYAQTQTAEQRVRRNFCSAKRYEHDRGSASRTIQTAGRMGVFWLDALVLHPDCRSHRSDRFSCEKRR